MKALRVWYIIWYVIIAVELLIIIAALSGCCGEGNDFIFCWVHTPIKTPNGTYVHRSGQHYWPVTP